MPEERAGGGRSSDGTDGVRGGSMPLRARLLRPVLGGVLYGLAFTGVSQIGRDPSEPGFMDVLVPWGVLNAVAWTALTAWIIHRRARRADVEA